VSRCFDCFADLEPTRFVVLKKLRDLPEGWQGSDVARREWESLNWDQVFICRDCAGWYGDHPIEVTVDEPVNVDAVARTVERVTDSDRA
jgi:hypothetical protein